VIPLSVHFSGVSYLDGVELENEQFYDKLDKCEKLPTTSQVTPHAFIEAFKKHLDVGDEIVGIFISSEISGTYNSACVAKKELASNSLFIVDSRNATMGLALLVAEAAKSRDAGFSAKQIAEQITQLTKKVRFLAAVNTLKYLRKGGRIPATTAVIGEIIGVKPIVSIIDGAVKSIGKARGMPAAINEILKKALDDLPDLRHGVVFCSSRAPELVEQAIERFKEPLHLTNWMICNIGSVIGVYAGRGAVGFAYIAK